MFGKNSQSARSTHTNSDPCVSTPDGEVLSTTRHNPPKRAEWNSREKKKSPRTLVRKTSGEVTAIEGNKSSVAVGRGVISPQGISREMFRVVSYNHENTPRRLPKTEVREAQVSVVR